MNGKSGFRGPSACTFTALNIDKGNSTTGLNHNPLSQQMPQISSSFHSLSHWLHASLVGLFFFSPQAQICKQVLFSSGKVWWQYHKASKTIYRTEKPSILTLKLGGRKKNSHNQLTTTTPKCFIHHVLCQKAYLFIFCHSDKNTKLL